MLALYVMTSPHANMIGLYYLPVSYAASDTGLSVRQVTVALEQLAALGVHKILPKPCDPHVLLGVIHAELRITG